MIVKVQVSMHDSLGRKRVLVYDEAKTFSFEGDLDPDTELLLGGRAKAFFHARIDGQKRIALGEGAPWQPW